MSATAPSSTAPSSTTPSSTDTAHALVEKRGHVLIVTMNRPEARNALSGEMMAIMRDAWDRVDSDPD
ncbi:MAG: crotonase/enoyl-CoA hydratase family protein, partial [Rhodococcus sp. (in: high G+C Gram-positive bacteria)]